MVRRTRRVGRQFRTAIDPLVADGRGWILLAVSTGQLFSLGTRLVFPALLPRIKVEYGLDNTAAGVILGALWIAYATAQLPGGLLGDRIGGRNTLVASALAAAAGLAVVVAAPTYAAFFLGVVLFSFGTGLYGTPRVTVLSDVFPDREATAIGINNATGNVGSAGLPVVAAVIAGASAWRAGIGILLPAFVLTAAGLWRFVPAESSGGSDTRSSRRETVRAVAAAVTTRPVLIVTGAMVGMTFVYQGFTAFFPTYLVAEKGLAEGTAASLLGLFFAGAVVLQPAAGGIADRYGIRRSLVAVAVATVITMAGFPFLHGVPALAALAVASSLQLAFWPIVFAYVMAVLPDDVRGGGFGLLRTAFIYIGSAAPVIVGVLADAGSFDGAFLLLAGAGAAAAVLCLLLAPVGRS